MNALEVRDHAFSRLHAATLKPLGYRKKGHWSIRADPPFYFTVYLRASRWSTPLEAPFWVDVQVFHQVWHDTLFQPKTFRAPAEGVPSLLALELFSLCEPPLQGYKASPSTNFEELAGSLGKVFVEQALPILEQCSTLEGVLSYYASLADPRNFHMSAAAVAFLLGRGEEVQRQVELAKVSAAHENERKWVEARARMLWSNPSVKGTGLRPAPYVER